MTKASQLTAAQTTCENQQAYADTLFPVVYECRSDNGNVGQATQWIAEHRTDLLRLSTLHGALLLRGFPVSTAGDFDAVVQSLGVPNFVYRESLSNAVRVNRTERVFSANEAPPSVQIFFHHEMAQTPTYPGYIFFFCEVPAAAGGATPICRSDVLFERLSERCPDFVRDCETRGLQYTNVMPDVDDASSGMGRSWRSTLKVETRAEAEARLRSLNYSWEWQGSCLKVTTPPLPAVMEVSPGRRTFFNQLIAAFNGWKDSRNDPSEALRHGDGSRLDADSVYQAVEIADELACDVNWQAGDVVLIDNTITMHARRPFQGTRKILASLGDMRSQSFDLTAVRTDRCAN